MNRLRIARGLAALAMMFGLSHPAIGSAQTQQAPAPAQPRTGKLLYQKQGCYQCHGLVGQGSIISGPALAGRGLDAGAIKAYVRQPGGTMPAYRPKILSEQDLDSIVRYILSLPAGPKAEDIPLLSGFVGGPAQATAQTGKKHKAGR